jgi:hypothetical protein
LSLFDPTLRPDRFLKYTLWFKESIAPPVKLLDDYYWKVSFSNLLVSGILSNQSDPVVPHEAIRYTLQESMVGLISTLLYVGLLFLVFFRMVKNIHSTFSQGSIVSIFKKRHLQLIFYCITWIILTVLLDVGGAFLYSSLVVPLVILLCCNFLNTGKILDRIFLFVVLLSVILNNSIQILQFRDNLSLLY